jgi:hypothetical protein
MSVGSFDHVSSIRADGSNGESMTPTEMAKHEIADLCESAVCEWLAKRGEKVPGGLSESCVRVSPNVIEVRVARPDPPNALDTIEIRVREKP